MTDAFHLNWTTQLRKGVLELSILNALADFAPGISKAGDPRRLRSGWINGIKELQVNYK